MGREAATLQEAILNRIGTCTEKRTRLGDATTFCSGRGGVDIDIVTFDRVRDGEARFLREGEYTIVALCCNSFRVGFLLGELAEEARVSRWIRETTYIPLHFRFFRNESLMI